jgi:chorismate mutase
VTPEHLDPAPTVPSRPNPPDSPDHAELPAELLRLRGSIDNIDAALVFLLAERFKATQQVGVLKAARGLPPSDLGREARQVARLRELAREAELDPVFAEKFLAFIVDEVIRHHVAIASEHTPEG